MRDSVPESLGGCGFRRRCVSLGASSASAVPPAGTHADEDHGDAGDPGHGAGGCGPRSQHHTGAGAYAGVDHGTAGYVDQPKRHDLPRNGPRTVGIRELWQQRQEQEEELRVQSADPCALQYLPDP